MFIQNYRKLEDSSSMGIFELHADLLNNILVRLPVESVAQLKCLSKSFNALISSHNFIKSHLNHALLADNNPTILVSGKTEIKLFQVSINNTGDFEDFNSKQIHSLREFQDDRVIKKVVGSTNGMLCLLLSSSDFVDEPCEICRRSSENFCFHDDVFVFCNPLTKSSWDLPGDEWKKNFRSHKSLYGFWYDDVEDDYKVAVMNRSSSERVLEFECEVYSLRSNSWSQVRCMGCEDLSYCRDSVDGFLFNSALHWVFYDYDFGYYGYIPKFILALDVKTYKLEVLPLPKGISCGIWELAMLNDCLVLAKHMDVLWVMEDYGIGSSWMRITGCKNESRFWFSSFTPVAFIDKRLLVSYEAFGNEVVLHDTVSRHVERIEIEFKEPSGFDARLKLKQLRFVGSLVQPYPPSVVDMLENLKISEEEDALESFDKFHISVMGGVSLDSELPEAVRRKYYELCCSKKSYLHKRWIPRNSKLAAKLGADMITKVVEIADSVRRCTFPTQKDTFATWDKSLRSFEVLGMKVGFLRNRIRSLFDNEEATNAYKYLYVKSAKDELEYNIPNCEKWVADSKMYCHKNGAEMDASEKARLEDAIEYYEKWVVDSKIQCLKYDAEIDALEPKAESYLARFQEEVNAPW